MELKVESRAYPTRRLDLVRRREETWSSRVTLPDKLRGIDEHLMCHVVSDACWNRHIAKVFNRRRRKLAYTHPILHYGIWAMRRQYFHVMSTERLSIYGPCMCSESY